MRVRHRSFLVVLGLGVAMSASSAPNLLSNSHFDTDLSGWIVVNDSFLQMTFDATLDANSSLTSGSAKFTKAAGMSCVPNLYQCVGGLTPGKPYDFGGSVYIPGGQPANTDAFVALVWFTGAACTGSRIVSPAAGPVLTLGAWTGASQIGQVAPAGVTSAAMNITACNAGGAAIQANFDELFLQEGSAISPLVDLFVIVEGPIRVPPGLPVQYRVRVKNLGPQPALGIRAGVYLPPGLVGVVVAGGGSYDPVQGWLSWPLFDQIDAGGEQVFTFTLPDLVKGKGYAVAAMLNGDTDYSNNTVAFQLTPAAPTATAIPALGPWGFGALWWLLVAAAALRFARSRDSM